MPKQPDTIRTLRAAINRRNDAEEAYRAALLAAVDEVGYAETAKAAGLSRQAVRQLVLRARKP